MDFESFLRSSIEAGVRNFALEASSGDDGITFRIKPDPGDGPVKHWVVMFNRIEPIKPRKPYFVEAA